MGVVQWEYKVEFVSSISDALPLLRSLGPEGWELVNLREEVFIFKRPKPPEPEKRKQQTSSVDTDF